MVIKGTPRKEIGVVVLHANDSPIGRAASVTGLDDWIRVADRIAHVGPKIDLPDAYFDSPDAALSAWGSASEFLVQVRDHNTGKAYRVEGYVRDQDSSRMRWGLSDVKEIA